MGRSGARKAAENHQSVGITGQLVGACAFSRSALLSLAATHPFIVCFELKCGIWARGLREEFLIEVSAVAPV